MASSPLGDHSALDAGAFPPVQHKPFTQRQYGDAIAEASDLLEGAADALSGLILLLRSAEESPRPNAMSALLTPVFGSIESGLDTLRPFLADHADLIRAAVLRAKGALDRDEVTS